MSELKPCPFCGGNDALYIQAGVDDIVMCGKCGAKVHYHGNDSAIATWNTRADDRRIAEMEEAMTWVIRDAMYKAPEQITPECERWVVRLKQALQGKPGST